jgi:hypothetical protein
VVSLQKVCKLGGHFFITVAYTYTVALIIDSQELIVRGLRRDTYSDGIPLLSQRVSVHPLLGLEVLLDGMVHSPCSGKRVSTRETFQEVMQRLVNESCKENDQLLVQQVVRDKRLASQLVETRTLGFDNWVSL